MTQARFKPAIAIQCVTNTSMLQTLGKIVT